MKIREAFEHSDTYIKLLEDSHKYNAKAFKELERFTYQMGKLSDECKKFQSERSKKKRNENLEEYNEKQRINKAMNREKMNREKLNKAKEVN